EGRTRIVCHKVWWKCLISVCEFEVGFSGFSAWIPGPLGVDFGEAFGGTQCSGGGFSWPLQDCSQSWIPFLFQGV
ncbi:AAEL004792-PA, partial [Aedes aegypti]